MFGTIAFPFKRIGNVSEAGRNAVSFSIQHGVPKLRPPSRTNPSHVNSVSADTDVDIANLIGGWIPSIFKSMEKTQVCDEQLSRARVMENKLYITKVKSIQETC